jgi:tetratricopeptide (TPR) repeat protein
MRNIIHCITSVLLVLFFAAASVGCVFYLCGCATASGSAPKSIANRNDADAAFQKSAGRPPTAKTLYTMADILAAQGRDADCELILKRIIREHPRFLPAYNSLAELQMRQQRINDAMDTLAAGLRISPKDAVLLNNLGMCRLIGKDYENALAAFTKAAGLTPGNTRYRANMAVALGLMGRYEESLALFKQILNQQQAQHNLDVLRKASAKDSMTTSALITELANSGEKTAKPQTETSNLLILDLKPPQSNTHKTFDEEQDHN